MKHFLAATDGSAGSDRAIDMAAQLARTFDGTLLILTVTNEGVTDAAIEDLVRSEGDVGEALDLITNQILRHAKERARHAGAPRVDTLSHWGDAAQSIIDCARDHRIDAIVVGRRGRGQLSGLLLGSVSQKLVTLAPCPVVVVP